MNKTTLNSHWLNSKLMAATLALCVLSLLIAWGVELLAKELFRLG
ncbi:MAG: hypothetical protein ACXWTT_05865 [Methylobacter sp.]